MREGDLAQAAGPRNIGKREREREREKEREEHRLGQQKYLYALRN
jgi:hypothetical protein